MKKTNSFSKKQNGKKQCFQKSLKNVQTNELIFQKPRTGSISKGTKNETASGPENGVRFSCDGTNSVLDFDVRSGLVTSNVSPKVSRHDDRN